MPEFILDHGSPEASAVFNSLDDFTQGYLEAAFFTSTGHMEDEDLEHASLAEMHWETIEQAKADCADFQTSFANLLDQAYASETANYDEARAGHDFWYTRNGHGVGFWDRNLGDLGDKLSEMARPYGETNLYRGDDGLIYIG